MYHPQCVRLGLAGSTLGAGQLAGSSLLTLALVAGVLVLVGLRIALARTLRHQGPRR